MGLGNILKEERKEKLSRVNGLTQPVTAVTVLNIFE